MPRTKRSKSADSSSSASSPSKKQKQQQKTQEHTPKQNVWDHCTHSTTTDISTPSNTENDKPCHPLVCSCTTHFTRTPHTTHTHEHTHERTTPHLFRIVHATLQTFHPPIRRKQSSKKKKKRWAATQALPNRKEPSKKVCAVCHFELSRVPRCHCSPSVHCCSPLVLHRLPPLCLSRLCVNAVFFILFYFFSFFVTGAQSLTPRGRKKNAPPSSSGVCSGHFCVAVTVSCNCHLFIFHIVCVCTESSQERASPTPAPRGRPRSASTTGSPKATTTTPKKTTTTTSKLSVTPPKSAAKTPGSATRGRKGKKQERSEVCLAVS